MDCSPKNKKTKKLLYSNLLILFLLILVVLIGFAIYFACSWFIHLQIHENIILKNESRAFEFWKDPPARIIRKYYFFNVDNPYEVEKGVEKPRLSERGPYTYVQKWEKRNVEFLGVEILRFSPVISLYFQANLSNGSESDQITVLNIPAMGLVEDAIKGNTAKSMTNMVTLMMDTKLFITRTVGALMGGYEDTLLEMASQMVPEKVKSNVFSLMMGKNGTDNSKLTIMTGNTSPEDKGKIVEWNGHKQLDFWYSDEANEIKGTDGTMYAPFMSREKKLYAFNSDMCRSFYLEYKEEKTLLDMNLITFQVPHNVFYNSSLNPLNEGFCANDCLGNGVQNISRCYGGISGFISQPHFLNAEKKFSAAVTGLSQNDKKHNSLIDFEPNTGVPIHGNIRFQISFYLPGDPDIDIIANVKSVLLPIIWFDESFDLNEDIRVELTKVAQIVRLTASLSAVGTCIGVILASSFIIYLISYIKNKRKYRVIYKSSTSQIEDELVKKVLEN